MFYNNHKAYHPEKSVISVGDDNRSPWIGVLEFDDQGEAWESNSGNPSQLNQILMKLDQELEKAPTIVLFYLHGWNNNADPNKKGNDFNKFKDALNATKEEMGRNLKSNVFGVYVSWRGGVFPLVDLYSREATARKVASTHLLRSVQAIGSKVRSHRGSHKGMHKLVAVGHSFGGKILEEITSDYLAQEIGKGIGNKHAKLTPLIDTTILVNPAVNALPALKMINLMREHKVQYYVKNGRERRDLPLVVAVGSTSDNLVKLGLKAWNGLNRNLFWNADKGGSTSGDTQAKSLYHSLAYFNEILTHKAYKSSEPPLYQIPLGQQNTGSLLKTNYTLGKTLPSNPRSSDLEFACFNPKNNKNEVIRYHMRPFRYGASPPLEDPLPYWIINVPNEIVKGHAELWNPNFFGLVTAIEAMKDTYQKKPELLLKVGQ